MIVMEDDTEGHRPVMLKAIEGPLVNMRNFGAPMVSDQQTDELRYGGWGRPGYGGYGGMGGVGYGRPYVGKYYLVNAVSSDIGH